LDGVIHGAGIIEDKLIEEKTPDSFMRVFGTKVDGAFLLSRKLRPDSLKFLAFFSSVAGRFGNRGQSDYAAANEILNKLAIYLDRQWPGRVVSINWGPWGKTGMVSAELQRQFVNRGVRVIPPSEGRKALDLELQHGRKGEVEVVLGRGPWETEHAPRAATRVTGLPLLNGISLSPAKGGGVELIRSFDPAHDLYLRDHQLDGKAVLPFAVAMELMTEVVQNAWPDLRVVGLRDLQVLRGVVLENGSKTLRLVARGQAEPFHERLGGDVHVEIRDLERAGHPYYRATLELADRLPEPPPYRPPLAEDLRPFSMSVEEAYRQWLFHGPLFQNIAEIHGISERGMVATCMPSSPRQCLTGDPDGQWLIDPVVFDSGLQLIILWARAHTDMTPLPSRFQRYRCFGALAGQVIRCHLLANATADGHLLHATLFFVSPDGRLLGALEDLECSSTKALNRLAGRSGH
jgi:hypothetical protein